MMQRLAHAPDTTTEQAPNPGKRYPRACSRCRVLTAEEGFALDRSKASGRRSHCKACDRRRGRACYDAREAARQAELAALAETHRERVEAAKKVAAAYPI
jgi:hypothetical protein